MPDTADERWLLTFWQTKPAGQEDFTQLWQDIIRWTAQNQPGAGEARLYQDTGDSVLFISLASWRDSESIDIWRETAAYGNFLDSAHDYCEGERPNILSLVRRVEAPTAFRPAADETCAFVFWQTRLGREIDFVSLWDEISRWTAANQPGAGESILLEDPRKDGRFFSFARWQTPEAAGALRETTTNDTFFDHVLDICHSFQPSTLRLVSAVVAPS